MGVEVCLVVNLYLKSFFRGWWESVNNILSTDTEQLKIVFPKEYF